MKDPDLNRIKDCLRKNREVLAGYIFGSRNNEKASDSSDLDIAVLLDDTVSRNNYGFLRQKIITSLIEHLSFDMIDVALLNTAAPLLCHEVFKKGTLLYSTDKRKRIEFTARVTKRYLDTIHLRNIQDKILHEKIRSGNFGYFKGSNKYSIDKIRKGASNTSAIK